MKIKFFEKDPTPQMYTFKYNRVRRGTYSFSSWMLFTLQHRCHVLCSTRMHFEYFVWCTGVFVNVHSAICEMLQAKNTLRLKIAIIISAETLHSNAFIKSKIDLCAYRFHVASLCTMATPISEGVFVGRCVVNIHCYRRQ